MCSSKTNVKLVKVLATGTGTEAKQFRCGAEWRDGADGLPNWLDDGSDVRQAVIGLGRSTFAMSAR